MKLTLSLLPVLLATALSAMAHAEEETSAPSPAALVSVKKEPDGAVSVRFDSMVVSRNGTAIYGVNLVKNAPYSAQAIHESRQTLADGNQISERRDVTTYYRDGAGRLRQEVRDRQGKLRSIVINDPVAGEAWTLDPADHVALKVAIYGRGADDVKRDQAAGIRAAIAAKKAAAANAGADGKRDTIVIKRVDSTDGQTSVRVEENVNIIVSKDQAMNSAMLGSALAFALDDAKWRRSAVTKDLGTHRFDDVKAVGTLRSYQIPAGAIGNRDAIVVSDETWVSPELQVTVYTKHSDPRSGDVVFKLENIKRGEPAAALFKVPADYVVKALPGQQQ